MGSKERMRPADINTVAEARAAMERLGKWRGHFAGWLLGTRAKDDPQSEWARDMAEKVLLLRAESSALARLLVDAKIITGEQFTIQVGQEAQALSNKMEERWAGITATDSGLSYDIPTIMSAGWMSRWLP
jgi:hypothetical protein